MNPNHIELVKAINGDASISIENRSAIVGAAIAAAFAAAAPLPSTAVESPSSYFTLTVQPSITNTLSDLNESLVFSVKETIEFIGALWNVRYAAAHPEAVFFTGTESYFESVFKVSLCVPMNLRTTLNNYTAQVIYVTNLLSPHITSLGE
jgi:hypothetical protein